MRPGHPVMLARRPDGAQMLCLPGNPLAAMTALLTLGLPLIHGMLGRSPQEARHIIAGEDFENHTGDLRVIAYRFERGLPVASGFSGAGMLRGLAASAGLLLVPPGGVAAGEAVRHLPLPWHAS